MARARTSRPLRILRRMAKASRSSAGISAAKARMELAMVMPVQRGNGKGDSNGGGVAPNNGKGKAAGKDGGDGAKPSGDGDANAQNKAKGKRKAKQDEDAGEWTRVTRKPAGERKLRDADWADPVLGYDSLIQMANGEDALVRAVALLDEEQRETVLSL